MNNLFEFCITKIETIVQIFGCLIGLTLIILQNRCKSISIFLLKNRIIAKILYTIFLFNGVFFLFYMVRYGFFSVEYYQDTVNPNDAASVYLVLFIKVVRFLWSLFVFILNFLIGSLLFFEKSSIKLIEGLTPAKISIGGLCLLYAGFFPKILVFLVFGGKIPDYSILKQIYIPK
jgi:hypothetical protein